MYIACKTYLLFLCNVNRIVEIILSTYSERRALWMCESISLQHLIQPYLVMSSVTKIKYNKFCMIHF